MTYASAAYLSALPVIAIPLIIYLIFRRRRRDIPWGAIYILRKVIETRSRAVVWLQYCIIALRTLACAALVLLFAAPNLPREPAVSMPDSAPSTHRAIILDTSESMRARFAGGTVLDAALAQARAILESTQDPGRADLLGGDGKSLFASFDSLPVDEHRLEIAVAECSERRDGFDLVAALRHAETLFSASPFTRRELYLLSDFRARDLAPEVLAEAAPRLLRLRERGVTFHALALRETGAANFALYECSPLEPLLLANQPVLFRARIGYFGEGPTGQTVLTVKDSRGSLLHEEAVTAGPGMNEVIFPLSLPAGEHRLAAALRPDTLEGDNALERQFSVLPGLNLMVVQDITDLKGFDNPRTWLELALRDLAGKGAGQKVKFDNVQEAYAAASQSAISKIEQGAVDPSAIPFSISVEGKIPEQINPDLLSETHLVIALDLDQPGPESLDALRGYVMRGGTVLLAPGASVKEEHFNTSFGPISPAPIATPTFKSVEPRRYEQCMVEAGDAAFLLELEDPRHGNLGAARFYRWFNVDPKALASEARVLLALSDGSPLLLERALGRGRVLLWTSGLGGDWNSMVVHPAFPVWLIRTLQRAAARQRLPRTLQPGEPVLLVTDAPSARVIGPGGIDEVVESVETGSRRFIRYDKTTLPGQYDLRIDLASEMPGELFDVVSPHPEADLRPATEIVEKDFADAAGGPIHRDAAALAAAVGRDTPGTPLARWLGALLLLALVIEAGLSRILNV
ncbi:MAG: BatA domain-containing protein [Planctomycetota bacterium]|nr:BatA domain-containing protein [Planctomycetota bacterium]